MTVTMGSGSRDPTTEIDMKTTTLGKSGLHVSRIAFGTWQLGGDWGSFDEDAAIAAIRRALDLGINFFDTAQGYGFGASERILGEALRPELTQHRESVVIATKGGLRPTASGLVRDSSPEWLRRGVDASLAALDVDYIDLYQVHWPDPMVPFSETAGALADLVAQGKIRRVGVSNYDVAQMEEFSTTLPVQTVQPPYHLFRRDIEDELLRYCSAQDIGVLVYGPLAHGLLTGTLRSDTRFADGDWRAKSTVFRGDTYRRNLEVVGELARFAAHIGITVSQLAIAWALSHPGVHVAIVGARQVRHLEDSAGAVDTTLTDGELGEIDRIMQSATPVSGPSPESV
jgi:aryl-alcohol dehydrogenase-like predicted oxidoreductase